MQNQSPRTNSNLTILQLILSGLGAPAALLVGLILVVLGVRTGLTGSFAANAVSLFSRAGTALAIGLLLIPPALLAVARLRGRPLPFDSLRQPFGAASAALALWPAVVALGWVATRDQRLIWFLLPVLQVLAVGIPTWWLVELGRRGLTNGTGSPQRSWGMFSVGILPNPLLIILVELLLLVVIVVLIGVWMAAQPGQAQSMQQLLDQLRQTAGDQQAILNLLRPLLARPTTILAVIGIGGVVMPMIEELLKPLGLWLLAGRLTSPAQGYVLGLIGGAAFALVESLNLSNNFTDSTWVSVVMIRAVTGLLHITTTGLVGWGLASAWTEGRYLRLAGTFLTAVLIHGGWNTLSLLLGFGSVLPLLGEQLSAVQSPFIRLAPILLTVMALSMFATLLVMNRKLRREQEARAGISIGNAAASVNMEESTQTGALVPAFLADTIPAEEKTAPITLPPAPPASAPNPTETNEEN